MDDDGAAPSSRPKPEGYGLCFHQAGQFTACHEARLSRPPRPPPGFPVWPRPTFNFLNVYNDAEGTALEFLEERQGPLNLAYMGGDFNCHSSVWDPRVSHHHAAAISLLETAALMGMDLAYCDNPGPTFISHNPDLRPSVIDLIFVRSSDTLAIQSHRHEHLRSSSDHVPIGVSVDLDLDAPRSFGSPSSAAPRRIIPSQGPL